MEGVVVHAARDKQYSDVNEAEETIQEIDKCSEFVGQQKRKSVLDKTVPREFDDWDILREIPPEHSFNDDYEGMRTCSLISEVFMKIVKIIIYITTFFGVILFGIISKLFILFMTSQIQSEKEENKLFLSNCHADNEELRVIWMWALFLCFSVPEVLNFMNSIRTSLFRKRTPPTLAHFLTVSFFETVHTIGLSLFVFCVLPNTKNLVQGIMIFYWACLVPSILGLLSRCSSRNNRKRNLLLTIDVLVMLVQLCGPFSFVVFESLTSKGNFTYWKTWMPPIALFLISFGWWKNYVFTNSTIGFIRYLSEVKKEMEKPSVRSLVYAFTSIWKMVVFSSFMVFVEWLVSGKITHVINEHLFLSFMECHRINLVDALMFINWITKIDITAIPFLPLSPFYSLIIQSLASFLCWILGKLACNIRIQKIGYALPVTLITPVAVPLMVAVLIYQGSITIQLVINDVYIWICIVGLLTQMWVTSHLWKSECQNYQLHNDFYCSLLIDQSMSFNYKRDEEDIKNAEMPNISENRLSNPMVEEIDEAKVSTTENVTSIYICATMWHENAIEMTTFLKSIFAIDKENMSSCSKNQIKQKIDDTKFEYEAHIYFDDAFETLKNEEGEERVVINRFVKQLLGKMENAAISIYKNSIDNMWLKLFSKISTPYGGCLIWSLPGKTKMVIHLKDKTKIRQGKRWSQVMYMFYLLSNKLSSKAITLDEKEKCASKLFILSIDGDTEFNAGGLNKLLEFIKKDDQIGAVCGRIHPMGSGWISCYQIVEYAYSHWFSKSAEQVFGSVLCAPGCFSLFRGRALMDKNIIRQFSSKASNAYQHTQYDKGEDRWLCTLLLQAGYKVKYCATSDAFTYCPKNFRDFCQQRSRWIPSDLVNTFDLIRNFWSSTHLDDSISFPYILYHIFLMITMLFAPGTVFLLLVLAMVDYLLVDFWISIVINVIPIGAFVTTCFFAKNDKKLLVAEILSAFYIVLTVVIIIGTTIKLMDGFDIQSLPFSLGIAIVSLIALAAFLHPREILCFFPGIIIYFVMIPSKNIIVFLYSVINLHNLSWGTREESETNVDIKKRETKTICDYVHGTKDDTSSTLTMDTDASNSSVLCSQLPFHSETVDEELILSQYWMKDSLILGQINNLCIEDLHFWKSVIEKYLTPYEVEENKHDKHQITADLRDFRNTSASLVILANIIFVIASIMLHKNIHVSTLTNNYFHMEVIPFILLTFNGFVLSMQFIGMLILRFETICQILTHTELKCDTRKKTTESA